MPTTASLPPFNVQGSLWPEGEAEVESGTIVLWYGTRANIPTGWLVCDGTNGTPDMQGRFPLGGTGDSGGMPYHSVYGLAANVANHKHTLAKEGETEAVNQIEGTADYFNYTDTVLHMPPYRTMHYIMKT